MSLITFIIPSINRPTIDNTIQSLLDQTNPNWECLLLYDGVDGKTFDDPRIKIIKLNKLGKKGERHGNAGLVRNEGIKMCNTEWIGFLDDDDTIHQDYVKTLVEKYTTYDFIVWRMKTTDGKIYPELTRNNIVKNRVGISISFKNKYPNLLFDSNDDGEDFYFVDKLQNTTSNFIITPEIFYNIRH
jgi:glycosyltransferase involved in cell wall biosynthesis